MKINRKFDWMGIWPIGIMSRWEFDWIWFCLNGNFHSRSDWTYYLLMREVHSVLFDSKCDKQLSKIIKIIILNNNCHEIWNIFAFWIRRIWKNQIFKFREAGIKVNIGQRIDTPILQSYPKTKILDFHTSPDSS